MAVHTRAIALCVAAAALIAAGQAPAQISSSQVRERYERNTKGTSIDDFVRRLNSDDPAVRLQGVKSLSESGDRKAIEYLVQALGDSDMRIKAKAIDALGDMRASEATPVLIQHLFLRATESHVKQRILASLGKIGDARATTPIMEFLERDLDNATCGTAIFALGELGAAEALDTLTQIERKKEENATLRRLAREAATKVRYHQAMMQTEAKQPSDTFLRRDERPPQRR